MSDRYYKIELILRDTFHDHHGDDELGDSELSTSEILEQLTKDLPCLQVVKQSARKIEESEIN